MKKELYICIYNSFNMIDKNSLDYIHVCTKCKIAKPNSEYPKKNEPNSRRLRNYNSSCKFCNKDRHKKYKKDEKEAKTYKLKYFFNLSY